MGWLGREGLDLGHVGLDLGHVGPVRSVYINFRQNTFSCQTDENRIIQFFCTNNNVL